MRGCVVREASGARGPFHVEGHFSRGRGLQYRRCPQMRARCIRGARVRALRTPKRAERYGRASNRNCRTLAKKGSLLRASSYQFIIRFMVASLPWAVAAMAWSEQQLQPLVASSVSVWSSCPLRVFVYPVNPRSRRDTLGDFGLPLPNMPSNLTTLYNTSQWALYATFSQRLHSRGCVVSDPADADAFYIPFDLLEIKLTEKGPVAWMGATEFERTAYRMLVDSTPDGDRWLARHGGRDHFMVYGGVERHGLSLISPENILDRVPILALEGDSSLGGLKGAQQLAVPYPSVFHDGESKVGAGTLRPWEYNRNRSRTHLAFYAGGGHGVAFRLRAALDAACSADPRCAHEDISLAANNIEAQPDQLMARLVKGMMEATFCLQPPGDTPSRKGIVDSVLLGCIPVLFEEKQLGLWPWHWRALDASVFLDGSAILDTDVGKRTNVLDALSRIPPSRVAQLRAAGAAVAYGMQYSATFEEGKVDAFELILRNLRRVLSRAHIVRGNR